MFQHEGESVDQVVVLGKREVGHFGERSGTRALSSRNEVPGTRLRSKHPYRQTTSLKAW